MGHILALRMLKLAEAQLEDCQLCEHRCRVNRRAGERGVCHADATARLFRHRVEYGEELEINPSHLFYLSGCDLRCAFCIAEANAFDPGRGEPLTQSLFAEAIRWGFPQQPRTIQWVGGEPTIHIPAILQAMSGCDNLPPVVWKSDFYGTPEAFALLEDTVAVYIADFKFGNDVCAGRIAHVDRYVETVTRNLLSVARSGNLIVRHLLLPGHFECCYLPIVRWLEQHLPNVKFSLRDGYLPRWRAKQFDDLRHRLLPEEAARARVVANDRLRVVL